MDAGEGVQQQLIRMGINPLRLRGIFISHLHGDHLFGLFPLLSTLALMGRKAAIDIYAPHPFGEILAFHREYLLQDIPYPIEWHRVDTTSNELIFENRTIEVWSIPLRHRLPTSGYLFREKLPELNVDKFKIAKYNLSIAQITAAKRGEAITTNEGERIENSVITYLPHQPRAYAYLSDTIFSARAAELCHGVDLLYHEATYSASEAKNAKARGHSTTHQAAKCAQMAEAGGLIIGHFSTRYKDLSPLLEEAKEIFANSHLAIEGETFKIEKRR